MRSVAGNGAVRLALDDDRLARLADEHRVRRVCGRADPEGKARIVAAVPKALTGSSGAGRKSGRPSQGMISVGPECFHAEVAADEIQVAEVAWRGDGRDGGVEMRAVADGQPVDVVGRTRIRDVVDLDHVTTIIRKCYVDERVGPKGVARLGHLGTSGVEDAQGRVERAVDRLGGDADEEPLASPAPDCKKSTSAAVVLPLTTALIAIGLASVGELFGSASHDSCKAPSTKVRGFEIPSGVRTRTS